MAMFKPSQSHSGGVIVKPYTGNIAQEFIVPVLTMGDVSCKDGVTVTEFII